VHARQLVAMNRPSDTEHRNVLNYMENTRPVFVEDREWLYYQEDLITLRPGQPISALERCLEWGVWKLNIRAIKVFV
jgi:hypothetical protein